jgi:hypothetical protein
MDQRIGPVQIAERALESMPSPLEDEPVVRALSARRHCEAKLKRHVEARDTSAQTDS